MTGKEETMATTIATPPSSAAPDAATERRLGRLRVWNIGVGVVLAVEAVAIALLTNDFSLPVTATYMSGPPGTPPELTKLFDLPLGWGIFAFVAISALALFTIAAPGVFDWYKRNLLQDRNYGRWIEYFFSSSLMIVLISMITGVSDIAALIAIFGVNAAMILFGWSMEAANEGRERPQWLHYIFGCIAGVVPWVVIGIALLTSATEPGAEPIPGFVIAIFVSLFISFNIFAFNMVLQYRKTGRWRDYLYGERVYMFLSLFAKTILAWQVFAGTLRP
jgi:hypothetical protein